MCRAIRRANKQTNVRQCASVKYNKFYRYYVQSGETNVQQIYDGDSDDKYCKSWPWEMMIIVVSSSHVKCAHSLKWIPLATTTFGSTAGFNCNLNQSEIEFSITHPSQAKFLTNYLHLFTIKQNMHNWENS